MGIMPCTKARLLFRARGYRKADYEQIAIRRGYYGDDDAIIVRKMS